MVVKVLVGLIILISIGTGVSIGNAIWDRPPNDRYDEGYYAGFADGKFSVTDNRPVVKFSIYPAFLDISLDGVRSTIEDKVTISNNSSQTHTFRVESTEPSSLYRYAKLFKKGNAEWLHVNPASVIVKAREKLDVPFTLVTKDIPVGDYVFALRVYSPDQPNGMVTINYEMRIFLSIMS